VSFSLKCGLPVCLFRVRQFIPLQLLCKPTKTELFPSELDIFYGYNFTTLKASTVAPEGLQAISCCVPAVMSRKEGMFCPADTTPLYIICFVSQSTVTVVFYPWSFCHLALLSFD